MELVNHDHNVFFDRNVASGYLQVKTDYCWVLGDSYTISAEGLGRMIGLLNDRKPDALIINLHREPVSIGDRNYTDCNILLRELGWYTTMLPSCILSKDFIEMNRLTKYYDSAFIHEGVFYDYLSTLTKIDVLFCSSIYIDVIEQTSKATSSWRKIPFRVFGSGWFVFIMSLPTKYDIGSKLFCISQHDKKKKLFSFHKILFLRMIGCMRFEDYKEAKPIMKFVTRTPLIFFDIISFIPSMPKTSKSFIEFLFRHHIIKKKWVEMVNYTSY